MKKMTALILALALLVFSLAGCSSNNSSSASGDDGDKVYRIGICQPLEHPALDAATKGFQDALTEALGDKVEFENKNAQQSKNQRVLQRKRRNDVLRFLLLKSFHRRNIGFKKVLAHPLLHGSPASSPSISAAMRRISATHRRASSGSMCFSRRL